MSNWKIWKGLDISYLHCLKRTVTTGKTQTCMLCPPQLFYFFLFLSFHTSVFVYAFSFLHLKPFQSIEIVPLTFFLLLFSKYSPGSTPRIWNNNALKVLPIEIWHIAKQTAVSTIFLPTHVIFGQNLQITLWSDSLGFWVRLCLHLSSNPFSVSLWNIGTNLRPTSTDRGIPWCFIFRHSSLPEAPRNWTRWAMHMLRMSCIFWKASLFIREHHSCIAECPQPMPLNATVALIFTSKGVLYDSESFTRLQRNWSEMTSVLQFSQTKEYIYEKPSDLSESAWWNFRPLDMHSGQDSLPLISKSRPFVLSESSHYPHHSQDS